MATPGKPPIHSHRDLIVWQRSMQLVVETYRVTERLPRREIYGLTAQMRRSVISIPGNIAEGNARRATGDYLRFLAIANGSLRELETYFDACKALRYLARSELTRIGELLLETGRMLMKLRQALKGRLRT